MNPQERQLIVEKLKKQIRKNNWDYLYRHPEIRAFIRVVLNEAVKEKPDQIYEFIANLFRCDKVEEIAERVNDEIKRLKNLKDTEWTEYDGDMSFSDVSEENHYVASSQTPIETLLKFSGIERNKLEVESVQSKLLPDNSLPEGDL